MIEQSEYSQLWEIALAEEQSAVGFKRVMDLARQSIIGNKTMEDILAQIYSEEQTLSPIDNFLSESVIYLNDLLAVESDKNRILRIQSIIKELNREIALRDLEKIQNQQQEFDNNRIPFLLELVKQKLDIQDNYELVPEKAILVEGEHVILNWHCEYVGDRINDITEVYNEPDADLTLNIFIKSDMTLRFVISADQNDQIPNTRIAKRINASIPLVFEDGVYTATIVLSDQQIPPRELEYLTNLFPDDYDDFDVNY